MNPTPSRSDVDKHWTVDRRIPLALIFALFVQTGSLVWWARGIESDVAQHSRQLAAIEAERMSVRIAERLAVLEMQMSNSADVLRRVDARLRGTDPSPTTNGR